MNDPRPSVSPFDGWLAALEQRHLADLRVSEVTRALRALSSTYVERRQQVRSSLDSAGKRAAFALFYGPLHFLIVERVVRALDAVLPAGSRVIDLGCGTGASGASWALCSRHPTEVLGVDRHPWAVSEAAWTYRHMGISGRTRLGNAQILPRLRDRDAVVAGWVLNELERGEREFVEKALIRASAQGTPVLVLEPIARSAAPWWDDFASRAAATGGRADQWRFPIELPTLVALLDKAAGLDHRVLTVRTLYLAGTRK